LRDTLTKEIADETALRARREQVEGDLAAIAARMTALETAHAADQPVLARAQQTWYELSSLQERFRSTEQLANERLRHLNVATEDERPGRDPDQLAAEAEKIRAQEAALRAALTADETRLTDAVANRQELERALADAERALVGAVKAIADRREGLAKLTGQVDAARTRAHAAEDEIARHEGALDEAEQTDERLTAMFKSLQGSGVKVASVATGFPSGQTFTDIKVRETQETVAAGADEIDMVIDRGAFLSGNYQKVFDEIGEVKEACGPAHLKVILETGDLANYDQVRTASLIAMFAGGDFIKTSTGKVGVNATLPVTLVMLEAIRDFYHHTGKQIGMKPAGGVRTAKQALHYLVIVKETLGDAWLTPDLFRFGASALLNDVLMQLEKERTGFYQASEDFSKD